MNPSERFDIQELNALSFAGVVDEVGIDPRSLRELCDRAESLMGRVKQEVDDPLDAGTFLRERALEWYRLSAESPEWTAERSARWAGIFADSRVSGGRLRPWLNSRLAQLWEEAARSRRWGGALARGLFREPKWERSLARGAGQQIRAEVAQAFLDDLAAGARSADGPLPLVRLSELAARRQVPTVNDALAALFNSPESGPFVVLHPNRYPDCDEVVIRAPSGAAAGAALAYAFASSRVARRGTGRPGPASDGPAGEEDLDGATVWEADRVSPATWRRLIEEHRRERRRLPPPPRDFRGRAAYEAFRSLVLEDAEFRRGFLGVRWRGRPTGIPLLVALLQKGQFVSDVATDHEYLEAELVEWAGGETVGTTDGSWQIGEWIVRREPGDGTNPQYRAERGPGAAAPS